MRNADRLLGIIYRECHLQKLFEDLKDYRDGCIVGEMTSVNETFLETTALHYTKKYPDNYTLEEVENALKVYIGYGNKYLNGGNNVCGLFFYCAERLFFAQNNTLQVKFDSLLEWDGFCNKIDANILIAAFSALHPEVDLKKTNAVVRHDNHTLSRILARGAADNHMHLKASGYSAEMSWAALLLCSFQEEKPLCDFIQKTQIVVNQGFALNNRSALMILKKVKLIRLYLEETLRRSKKSFGRDDWKTSSFHELQAPTKKQMQHFLASENDTWCHTKKAWLERSLVLAEKRYPRELGTRKYFIAERMFLQDMFEWVRTYRDRFILQLFNIYLASLSQIRFLFVQDNEGMGFRKFKLREDVKDDLLTLHTDSSREVVCPNDVYHSVFDRCYQAAIIKQAEFRIAPKDEHGFIKLFMQLQQANEEIHKKFPKQEQISYGIIVHFIKQEKLEKLQYGMYRWQNLRELYWVQTLSLLSYLEKGLRYNDKIVGIDAANYEAQCRPEVLAPCFRRIRQTVDVSRGIGLTYHVGEAFDALCSGLRAIDEAICFMNLRRGDRLGHALALGIDVDAFQKAKRSMVCLTLQNHVDNLAWLYNIIFHFGKTDEKWYLRYLEEEFRKCCTQLYDKVSVREFDISDYVDAWTLRGDDPELYNDDRLLNKFTKNYLSYAFDKDYMINRLDPEHQSAFENESARELYRKYLFNVQQFYNGENLINLQLNESYWGAVKVAQRLLREKIYRLELSIETNPSSNRKISYIRHFVELPLLSFNRHYLHGLKEKTGDDLPVSINTDNCDIFQTDLENEYALIVASLQREGLDRQEIYDYINYLRESSLLQAFRIPT